MPKKNYNDYLNPVQKDISKPKQHAGAILDPSVEKPPRGQDMETATELGAQDNQQRKLRKGQNKK